MCCATHGRLPALVILVLLVFPVWTHAQTPQSFLELQRRLEAGARVIVVDPSGMETIGAVVEISDQSLVITPARITPAGLVTSSDGPRQTLTPRDVAAVLRATTDGKAGAIVYAARGSLGGLRGVKTGQTLIVTDSAGRKTTGKVAELTPGTLVLLTKQAAADGTTTWSNRQTFAAADVNEIRQPGTLWNGLLIGLGFGIIPGAVATASCRACDDIFIPNALMTGAIGAGIGLGIDAAFGPKRIYAAGNDRSAGLTVVPILGSGGTGARLSWRF